jgi:hypothetical protein
VIAAMAFEDGEDKYNIYDDEEDEGHEKARAVHSRTSTQKKQQKKHYGCHPPHLYQP